MNLIENLQDLGRKALDIGHALGTEEAAKAALVMPFITILGYDVHNPEEVIPEYTADFAIKKGEKVDFAIKVNGTLAMLIECKKYGDELNKHTGQLFRYFSVTKAKIGILTNGIVYKFFSDLVEPNKLDQNPFYILDLSDVGEHVLDDLPKITKDSFDLDGMIAKAVDLKYIREIKGILQSEFTDPTWLARELVTKSSFKGNCTLPVMNWFSMLIKRAVISIENDYLKMRLKILDDDTTKKEHIVPIDDTKETKIIETMVEEIEGYHYVKSIVSNTIDPERVFIRDTHSYCGVIIDNNNRKPLCKLYFNNLDKKVIKIGRSKDSLKLKKVSDLLKLSKLLKAEATSYIKKTDK